MFLLFCLHWPNPEVCALFLVNLLLASGGISSCAPTSVLCSAHVPGWALPPVLLGLQVQVASVVGFRVTGGAVILFFWPFGYIPQAGRGKMVEKAGHKEARACLLPTLTWHKLASGSGVLSWGVRTLQNIMVAESHCF